MEEKWVLYTVDVDNGNINIIGIFYHRSKAINFVRDQIREVVEGDQGGFEEWLEEQEDPDAVMDDYVDTQMRRLEKRLSKWKKWQEMPKPSSFKDQQEWQRKRRGFEWGIFEYVIVKAPVYK